MSQSRCMNEPLWRWMNCSIRACFVMARCIPHRPKQHSLSFHIVEDAVVLAGDGATHRSSTDAGTATKHKRRHHCVKDRTERDSSKEELHLDSAGGTGEHSSGPAAPYTHSTSAVGRQARTPKNPRKPDAGCVVIQFAKLDKHGEADCS